MLELALLALVAAVAMHAVFGQWLLSPELARSLVFLVLPVIILGAFRLPQGAAPLLVAAVTVSAIQYTAAGTGPFVTGSGPHALVLLEIFIGVSGLTALLLAAIAAEREASRRALQAAHDSLERRVLQRTDALQAANRQLEQEVAARIREGEALRKLSSIAEHTSDLVYVTDVNGVIEYVNSGFEQATGYRRDQVIGRRPSLFKSGRHDEAFYRDMWSTLLQGRTFRAEMVNRKADGTLYNEEKTVLPLKDHAGRITHFVATGKDVTEQVRTRRKLDHLAFHDQLTGLPNRALFRDRLEQAMARARRENHLVALMFLDLDRFKNINDTLGHGAGDRLLVQVAERLRTCVRQTDTVARLGGDEFTVIMEQVSHVDQVGVVAQKILDSLAQRFEIGSSVLRVAASIGIAVWPWDDNDADDLIRDADVAMYHAKDHGRNRFEFYSAEMSARVARHMALEAELEGAIDRGEFVIHYQPIVDLASGRVRSCEALLRWRHPERGLVLPGEFVPALEESGRIVPITQWVLGELGRQQRLMDEAGAGDVELAVNFTAGCFAVPEMLSCIQRIFESSGLDPKRLIMEVTESVLIDSSGHPVELIRGLKEMGVTVALDDFGTGQSSLSHLRRFAIDMVKIDRDFVRDVPGDNNDSELVAAIIAMAHNLNKHVVAEGVETQEQLSFLSGYGCDAVQGWLFSRAVPGEELIALLRASGGILHDRTGQSPGPCTDVSSCGCSDCDEQRREEGVSDARPASPAPPSTDSRRTG
jgi:diguanylate cyclase (GGDEF)-like protein/PAS domain S-box-containing protein